MKGLFISDLNTYGRGYQRSLALSDLVNSLDKISHTRIVSPGILYKPSIIFRIFWKLRIPIDIELVNTSILTCLKKENYDWIWIDNPNTIYPWILYYITRKYPQIKIISFSEDDMYVKHGHSFWYRLGARFYNAIYTTKLHNLAELYFFGAKRVCLTMDCFNENIHKKLILSRDDISLYGCDVSAIGAYEEERASSLIFLARNGIKVTVWGSGWGELKGIHPNLDIRNQFLFGLEYPKAICASKISINFLRKINRDEITSRSMEIPACGVFMIAERTSRHLSAFVEGVEAEFFGDDNELLYKVNYYLSNSVARENIANKGRARCLTSGYGMRVQYAKVIKEISQL